jgi:hypothetical protein
METQSLETANAVATIELTRLERQFCQREPFGNWNLPVSPPINQAVLVRAAARNISFSQCQGNEASFENRLD